MCINFQLKISDNRITTMSSVQVKQERHDEAEIRELAAKMSEQHKQQMAKIQQQNAAQRQAPAAQITHQAIAGGQTNILNYLTRNQKPTVGHPISNQIAQPSSSKAIDSSEASDNDKKDEESQKGHFGKPI